MDPSESMNPIPSERTLVDLYLRGDELDLMGHPWAKSEGDRRVLRTFQRDTQAR